MLVFVYIIETVLNINFYVGFFHSVLCCRHLCERSHYFKTQLFMTNRPLWLQKNLPFTCHCGWGSYIAVTADFIYKKKQTNRSSSCLLANSGLRFFSQEHFPPSNFVFSGACLRVSSSGKGFSILQNTISGFLHDGSDTSVDVPVHVYWMFCYMCITVYPATPVLPRWTWTVFLCPLSELSYRGKIPVLAWWQS